MTWNWSVLAGLFLLLIGYAYNVPIARDLGICVAVISVGLMFPAGTTTGSRFPAIQTITNGLGIFWGVAFVLLPLTIDRTLMDWPETREALNKRGVYTDLQIAEITTPHGWDKAVALSYGADVISDRQSKNLLGEINSALKANNTKKLEELTGKAQKEVEWRNSMSDNIRHLGDMSKPIDIPSKPVWWRMMGLGISILLTMLALSILGQGVFAMSGLLKWAGAVILTLGFILFFLPELGNASSNPFGVKWTFIRVEMTASGRLTEKTNESPAKNLVLTDQKMVFDYKTNTGMIATVELKSTDGLNYSGTFSRPGNQNVPMSLVKKSEVNYTGESKFGQGLQLAKK